MYPANSRTMLENRLTSAKTRKHSGHGNPSPLTDDLDNRSRLTHCLARPKGHVKHFERFAKNGVLQYRPVISEYSGSLQHLAGDIWKQGSTALNYCRKWRGTSGLLQVDSAAEIVIEN